MPASPRRKLIHTLALPPGSDARALAEEVAERFRAASISGSGGEHEIQLMSPASLVVLIGPKAARFFEQPLDLDEEDEDDDDEEDPYGTAQEISDHLARFVGLAPDDEDEDGKAEKQPLDDADKLAEKVVALLLERGLLELTTPRSKGNVESHMARCLDKGLGGAAVCNALADVPGVAELYTSDEEMDALIAECRPPRPPAKKPAAPTGKGSLKATGKAPGKASPKSSKRT